MKATRQNVKTVKESLTKRDILMALSKTNSHGSNVQRGILSHNKEVTQPYNLQGPKNTSTSN